MPLVRRLRIHGKVQGVGYRDWTVAQARLLGLAGWVRNRVDGTVEACVKGEAATVDSLVALCHDGPPRAKVSRVEVSEGTGDDTEAADTGAGDPVPPIPESGFERLPTR